MSEVFQKPTIELKVTLVLTEAEARALHAVASYDPESVIKALAVNVSPALAKDHRDGLRSLLDCRTELAGILERTDEARRTFNPPPSRK